MASTSLFPAVAAVLAFTAVLTFADSVNNTALPLRNPTEWRPGFWNLGTTNLILSGASDLIGQLVIGYIADRRGKNVAMNINASSLLASSVSTLLGVISADGGQRSTVVIAPLLKCFGGGAHTTAFLALVLLHREQDIRLRSSLYYATGAVIVATQSFASFVTPLMARQSKVLPFAISAASCVLAYGLVAACNYTGFTTPGADIQDDTPDAPVLQPLIPRPAAETPHDESGVRGALGRRAKELDECTGFVFSAEDKNPASIVAIFFLMAISKATRPLFTSYIQHRAGLTPGQAQTLWLTRTAMSIAIFAIILPASILRKSLRESSVANFTLYAGKGSILLMGFGALLIGISDSLPGVIAALVINTLGVATDLSLLGFLANSIPEGTAGRILMLVSSFENAGTLLGIGILYPIYQWSMQNGTPFVAGGLPYYICAAIYAVVAGLIWRLAAIRSNPITL